MDEKKNEKTTRTRQVSRKPKNPVAQLHACAENLADQPEYFPDLPKPAIVIINEAIAKLVDLHSKMWRPVAVQMHDLDTEDEAKDKAK